MLLGRRRHFVASHLVSTQQFHRWKRQTVSIESYVFETFGWNACVTTKQCQCCGGAKKGAGLFRSFGCEFSMRSQSIVSHWGFNTSCRWGLGRFYRSRFGVNHGVRPRRKRGSDFVLFVGEADHTKSSVFTGEKTGLLFVKDFFVQILVVTPTCRQQKMFGFSSELDLKQRRLLLSPKKGGESFRRIDPRFVGFPQEQ